MQIRSAEERGSTPVHISERSSGAIKSLDIEDDQIDIDLRMNNNIAPSLESNTLASYVSGSHPINIV